jgi:hypothetical protein
MNDNEMHLNIINKLDILRPVPPRDLGVAARGKAIFLKQASVMRSSISRKQETRQKSWINAIFPAFPSGQHRVVNAMIAAVIAFVMFFGGAGTTVYAAQGSLPDQPLYPLKTWSEDTLISLAGSPQSRLKYTLNFSDRRITEMAGLLSTGRAIPEMTMTRLQAELQQALELVAGMDDPQMLQGLEQIRLRAGFQLQRMNVLISRAPVSVRPALFQTQAQLMQQDQLCVLGQADPRGFRLQVWQREQNRNGKQLPTASPMPAGNGYAPGPGNGLPTPLETPVPTGNSNDSGQFQPIGTQGLNGPGPQSPPQPPQSGDGPQGPALQSPACTPVPTGGGNGSGGNQPTAAPGHNGPTPQSLNGTPHSGGGT